jgi:uncharacterized membrane protein
VVSLCGGLLSLVHHRREPADYVAFRGVPAQLRSIRGVFAGAVALDARSVIQLGLLILVATPVARVALALAGFARLPV